MKDLKNRVRVFAIKIRSWEYWPFEVVYLPIFFYWMWLSLKARSFFFFSSSNPSIETGGMMGESKSAILKLIPDMYKPLTIYGLKGSDIGQLRKKIVDAEITYPFIIKPDIGERGNGVEKIKTEEELRTYIKTNRQNFIIQEYIDFPVELGVFYYRIPGEEKGTASSVVMKEYLSVKGDGISSVEQLMSYEPRAFLQLDRFRIYYPELLRKIPGKEEEILLEPIGNHCRGTKFLDANYLINNDLLNVFDKISLQIKDFYFGRYDLKCSSIEDLYEGKNILIMELNGAGAEPAHIYQPGFSIIKGYKTLFHHWSVLYKISKINEQNGYLYMSLRDGLNKWKEIKRLRTETQ